MRIVLCFVLSLVVFSSAEASLSALEVYGTPLAHVLEEKNGRVKGPFVEVVRAVFKEAGVSLPKIRMVSVRRGKALLFENPNAVVFPFLTSQYIKKTSSSPLKIGMFVSIKGSLIAKKELVQSRKPLLPSHLEDDRQAFKAFINSFSYVLVNTGVSWSILHPMGLQERHIYGRVPTPQAAARVLGRGKVQIWPFVWSGAQRAFKEAGLNPSDFESLYSLKKISGLSLVISAAAKGADVRALRIAFQKMKTNGTFARLMGKGS